MRITIRTKITVLVLLAVTASLAGYIMLGTSLIIHDKSSYIYDYTLLEVKSVADVLDSQIEKVNALADVVANSSFTPAETEHLKSYYDENSKGLFLKSLTVLTPDNASFKKIWGTLPDTESLEIFNAAGWNLQSFESHPFLLGTAKGSQVPIAFRIQTLTGQTAIVVAEFDIQNEHLSNRSQDFLVQITDSLGKQIGTTTDATSETNLNFIESCKAKLLKSTFPSGEEDCNSGDREFILAFHKIEKSGLVIFALISKKDAFRSANLLVERSIVLGIGILLLVLSIALLFARSLTGRLERLSVAVGKVAEGDFSIKIDLGRETTRKKDELDELSRSFNFMSGKISNLLEETVQKARMQKELETAQIVQTQFFPTEGYQADRVSLAGKILTASECGGDWWHHFMLGEYLVVALGDVTGHGVSSALITAATHGAFIALKRRLLSEKIEDLEASLNSFVQEMNQAVYLSGKGDFTMTFVMTAIHTKTGALLNINASHQPVYVCRKTSDAAEPFKQIRISGRPMPALGYPDAKTEAAFRFQLEPGDTILWYTDGLLECSNEAGESLKKPAIFKLIDEATTEFGNDSQKICQSLFSSYQSFMGDALKNSADDVAMIVASFT